MEEMKKLDKELEKVVGGEEPEEFEWHTKGYVTPEKDETPSGEWRFSAIGQQILQKINKIFGIRKPLD